MNNNKKLLKDFTKYCFKHPEERFWQALRNWSECNQILRVSLWSSGERNTIPNYEDTFYFEERDK
jgi:hypothetical protein